MNSNDEKKKPNALKTTTKDFKKSAKHVFFIDVNNSKNDNHSTVSSSFSKSDSSVSTESPGKDRLKRSKDYSPKRPIRTNDHESMDSPKKSAREKESVKNVNIELEFVRWKDIFCIPSSMIKTFKSLKIPKVESFEDLMLKHYVAAYVVVDQDLVEAIDFKTIFYVNETQSEELKKIVVSCPSYHESLTWCGVLSTQKKPLIEELDTLLPGDVVAAYIHVEINKVETVYYVNKEVPECYPLENISQSVYEAFEEIPFNKFMPLSVKWLKLLNHTPTRYSLTPQNLGEMNEIFYRATYANIPLYQQTGTALAKLEEDMKKEDRNPKDRDTDELRLKGYQGILKTAPAETERLNALKDILLLFFNNAYKEFQAIYRVSEEDHIQIAEGLMARLVEIFNTDINIACKSFCSSMSVIDMGLNSVKNPFNLNSNMSASQLQAWLEFQAKYYTAYLNDYRFNIPSKQLMNYIKNYIVKTDMEKYEQLVKVIEKNSLTRLEAQYSDLTFYIKISPPEETTSALYMGK